jgi:hypothetical protein
MLIEENKPNWWIRFAVAIAAIGLLLFVVAVILFLYKEVCGLSI